MICALVGLFTTIVAQGKLNIEEVDKYSYQLYQEEKWDELIKYSQESMEQGIDFFYLRARTGIAWYNLGKYRNASTWFIRAGENDLSADWLQEYLYYSLIFSGRTLDANKYASSFSDATTKKIGFKRAAVTNLTYETGYSFNTDFDDLKIRDFKSEANLGDDYGEAYLLKNYIFHSFDLFHRIAPNFTLQHNLTYIGVNRETLVDWVTQTTSPVQVKELQYYVSPVCVIGKRLNVSTSLNYILGNADVYAGSLNSNLDKVYTVSKSKYSDYLVSSSVWSHLGNLSYGVEINGGDISNSRFYQVSGWGTWYPLSNLNLYFTPRIYFKSDNDINSFAFKAMGISGGAQLGQFHLYGQYLFGDMENFVESAGSVIANYPGRSDWKLMGSLYFPFSKRYQFVLRYINQNIIEEYQVYTAGEKSNSLEYSYLKNTLTGGISWTF